MHEHFDADDQPCRSADAFYTLVTREPEWDDTSRGRALRLAEYERNIDRETGLPLDVAYDPKQAFLVDFSTNHARKAIEQIRAKHAELPEHKDKPGWDTHRRYYATPVDPTDLPRPDGEDANADEPLRPRPGPGRRLRPGGEEPAG